MPATHLLSVSIGFNPTAKRWDFERIGFDNEHPYFFGENNPNFPVNADDGIRAICLLTLLVERARSRELPVKIPTKLRERIKPYWSSKYKAGWPKILFGEDPWKKYIHGNQKGAELVLDLDESVGIEIDFADLKTGQHPPTLDEVLAQFHSPSDSFEEEDDLIINIHKAGSIISSLTQKGSVRRNNQIWVEITAPIEESICALWVDSDDNGLFTLTPTLDARVNIPKEESCTLVGDDDFRTHRIPGRRSIGISGEGGTETCLVLRRKQTFGPAEESEIQEIIQQTLEARNPTAPLENPRYIYGTCEEFKTMEPQAPETRLEPGWEIENWEAQVAKQLEGHYDRLHLFHIPNRGSRIT